MAERFNAIGESAQAVGLTFAYHNHGYGIHEMEGEIPLRILLAETDPDLVAFEMDIFWTAAGGADPVALLREFPDHYQLLHIKDMQEAKTFSGDGGDASQWMELFPYMCSAGEGVMDLSGIIAAAEAGQVKHFLVEQDLVANPQVALGTSLQYLKGL